MSFGKSPFTFTSVEGRHTSPPRAHASQLPKAGYNMGKQNQYKFLLRMQFYFSCSREIILKHRSISYDFYVVFALSLHAEVLVVVMLFGRFVFAEID